ncbi:MAG TPA: hypothetical protein VFG35_01400 [Actinoplanes sp.]|nr:hypothetical protein [Actinoplanes sp.]
MPMTPETLQRLAFIRYLHHLGIAQSRLPEPQCSAAVLMFHDAVESFLLLATEHHGAAQAQNFMKYWDSINAAIGTTPAGKQGMDRLNRLRNGLKHQGQLLGQVQVQSCMADTATFFAANSQLLFGVDYDQVSMAAIIAQEKVGELARESEKDAAGGDLVAAMIKISDAADLLLTPRVRPRGPAAPLKFGDNLVDPQSRPTFMRQLRKAKELGTDISGLGRQVEQLSKVVIQLQAAARLTAIGVDYPAYIRFKNLTPAHVDFFDGRREYRAPAGYDPTYDDYRFCLQFVITLSLRLAEAHANLEQPAWIADRVFDGWGGGDTIGTAQIPTEGYL